MRISDCSSDVCSSDLASAGCAGEDGTAGEVAEGTAASPVAGGGAAGTSDIRPRSCWTRPGCEVRVTCQAMNRVMAKNTIASHLVALDRKFDEPREPNTVAERTEEHTSELQSLIRISYAAFCLKKKTKNNERE